MGAMAMSYIDSYEREGETHVSRGTNVSAPVFSGGQISR